ncbi:MAG: SusC/RagA family TonB-linked outer membrane protein [Candidatus Cyclobacteriaceae bacterium M2_1C_046]
MLRLSLIVFLCITAAFGNTLTAQHIVSGSILSSENDEPLVGASVMLKGTTRGTITDVNGNYRLEIANEDLQNIRLIFSYIGFTTKEVPINNRNVIDVKLDVDATQLTEVVVTAFGVATEKKAINYSVQEVKSAELVESNQDNLVNALQGKVAGVQITNSSGSPGASSHILIRGANSVNETTSNQPLFVVDGIPISNSASFGGANRAMDINPNDIESITVLKGGAAAALYGLEAGNGAIVITTKRGRAGVTSVNFSSSVSVDQAFRTSPRQMIYKQGNSGVFDPETTNSWGPLVTTNEEVYDNVDNFLEAGLRQKYDLSLSSATDKLSGYMSANYLNHDGIFPGENLRRYGLLLKGTNKISDKVEVNTSLNLVNSNNVRTGFGTMYNIYRWPINDDMSQYLNPDGSKRWLIDREPDRLWNNPENPYWRAENNPITDDVNRIISLTSFSWNIIEPLTFTYRLGGDFTNQHYKSIARPGSAGSAEAFSGRITEIERSSNLITSTALLGYDKRITEKISVNAMVGQNIQLDNGRNTYISGSGYRNTLLDNINNLQTIEVNQNVSRRRIAGVFGDIKLDYDGVFYLGVTARNDWSSTLAKDNNSFFYPSVSGGIIFSEFLKNQSFLSYGKIRGSWAQIGKDAPAHRTTAVLENYNAINGGFKYDYYAGNPNIAPEITTTWEVGADLRFLNGRFRLDMSYYNMITEDAIIQSRISPSSGWIQLVFNSGSIQNKGIEIVADAQLVNTGDLSWNLLANISGNRSTLIELPEFVSKLPVTSGQLISAAIPSSLVGEPLLALEGTVYLYNEFGQLVVDENGYPRIGRYATDEDGNFILNSDGTRVIDGTRAYLGNREPKAIIGITNSVNYKKFNISFLVDIRIGGDVLNAANATMIANGSSGYLEEHRNRSTVFTGVVEQEGGFVENTNEVVLDQGFFNNYASVGTNFVEDASWTRLRYLTIGYILPENWANKIGMKDLMVSATGRNLALWTKYSGGDPETNYAGAGLGGVGTVGLDYFNVPAVQGVDITLRANF